MFSCDKCDYTTTDRSNFRRHCNRKVPCSGAPNVRNSHPNVSDDGFTALNDKQIVCMCCEKQLLKVNKHRHACRGAPPNTCPLCFKKFSHSQSLFVHKKRCKQNPTNINPPQTLGTRSTKKN